MPSPQWQFFVSAAQTALLLVLAGATVYTMILLRSELRGTAAGIKKMLDGQSHSNANLERLCRRVTVIEARLGIGDGSTA